MRLNGWSVLSLFFTIIGFLVFIVLAALLILLKTGNIEYKEQVSVVMFVLSIATLIPALLARYFIKRKEVKQHDDIDNQILSLAINFDGKITAADLAFKTPLSLNEANEHLERNYQEGYCEKLFTKDRLVPVYFFRAAVSYRDKQTAVSMDIS